MKTTETMKTRFSCTSNTAVTPDTSIEPDADLTPEPDAALRSTRLTRSTGPSASTRSGASIRSRGPFESTRQIRSNRPIRAIAAKLAPFTMPALLLAALTSLLVACDDDEDGGANMLDFELGCSSDGDCQSDLCATVPAGSMCAPACEACVGNPDRVCLTLYTEPNAPPQQFCTHQCDTDADCPSGLTCFTETNNGTGACIPGDGRPDIDVMDDGDMASDMVATSDYRYVRVDDLSMQADTIDGGADIDAIILDKGDGTQHFATKIEGFVHGGGTVTGDEIDPTAATGAPDTFSAYPDTTTCDVENGSFVSLGGMGGFLIVEMAATIDEGDVITVLEVGGCDFGTGEAIPEPVDVSVSTAREIDASWEIIGTGDGPEIVVSVPALP